MKVKVLFTGSVIDVRQAYAGSDYFIDNNDNPYKATELDFNITQATNSSDSECLQMFEVVNGAMMSHSKEEKEYEKETYYRELRGNILLAFIEKMENVDTCNLDKACKWMEDLVKYVKDHDTKSSN